MLDLLIYCHIFASMRYSAELAAAAALATRIRTQCARWAAHVVARRQARSCPFDYWTDQGLLCSLDRLDAYVSSMA